MHLILTGATGLVGSGVLDVMLKSPDIAKISILSRRPVPMAEKAADPRVKVILHQDFNKYESDVLDKLKGANGVVWALGISQNKVTKEEYIKITKDYALAAAGAFADLPPEGEPFRFVYVSGSGTTQTPGLFSTLYSRVKGETETLLSEMRAKTPRLLAESVRPAAVDADQHPAIQPYIPDPGRIYTYTAAVALPPIRHLAKWLHSPTEPLGRFLTGMAMGKFDKELAAGAKDIVTLNGGLRIVENSAIRRLEGLP